MKLLEAIVEMARDENLRVSWGAKEKWYDIEDSLCFKSFVYDLEDLEVKSIQEIEKENFKLEVGCYYEDRNGEVCFILSRRSIKSSFHFNAILCDSYSDYGSVIDASYASNGNYCSDSLYNSRDLIKKLEDQKWPWVEELRRKLCS